MFLISHRGNLYGKQPDKENDPVYIKKALKKGFDVEIDVWFDNGWYLGHDGPTYPIEFEYLKNEHFWCHAKNLEALEGMISHSNIHCFWHQEDDLTLTSRNIFWVYPGKPLNENSISVLPELNKENPKKVLGICSDFIEKYKLDDGSF
tara:strand:- start:157 stop:600 length:444 start_codon:yes stop_codon:yes gene_type:complete